MPSHPLIENAVAFSDTCTTEEDRDTVEPLYISHHSDQSTVWRYPRNQGIQSLNN